MSHIYTETYSKMPQFLASEVGMRTVTRQIPESMGIQDGCKKIVPAGTVFPVNGSTAEGVLFEPVDVTHGDHEGAVIVAGYLYENRLPVAPVAAAKTAMKNLNFETAEGMVR
ncbi:hypothetical protein [Caproiciproducens sp.]|uniref:hypothetical protein n=1 Tax=Caproiciproducens sp. TaxID=1954376 RepID=UPI00289CD384|nr:hypothetical protein [Caproiciproducens sp.]